MIYMCTVFWFLDGKTSILVTHVFVHYLICPHLPLGTVCAVLPMAATTNHDIYWDITIVTGVYTTRAERW